MTQLDPSIILRAGAVQPLQAADILEKRQQIQLRNIEQQRQQRQDQVAEMQLAASQKHLTTLADVGKRAATGDMAGAENSALGAGDFELVKQLRGMSDDGRKRMQDISQNTAPLILSLKSVPPEQRAQELSRIAPDLMARGLDQPHLEALLKTGLTDEAIDRVGVGAMTIADYNKKIEADRNFGMEGDKFHHQVEKDAADLGLKKQEVGISAGRAAEDRRHNRVSEARAASDAAEKQNAVLTTDAVTATVDQIMAGDPSAMSNLGRGTQGALNIAMVKNELARRLKTSGMSGADIAKANAAFVGMKAGARTMGNTGAKVDYGVNELASAAPLALRASSAVPRGSFVPLNQLQQMIARGGGNAAQKDFAVKTQALLNAYNLVAARSGSSVGEREHNATLLQTADSPEAYRAAIAAMQQEGEVAKAASKLTMGDVTGQNKPAPPKPANRPPLSAIFK